MTWNKSLREDDLVETLGVVAVIDALGFAALADRYAAPKLVRLLQAAKRRAEISAALGGMFEGLPLDTAAFSDTVVVSCRPRSSEVSDVKTALVMVASHVCDLQTVMVGADPPINYRGCISVGPLVIEDGFFVGKAVNDAAAFHEKSAASVVWLTPDAREVCALKNGDSPWFLEWDVPHHGQAVRTRSVVINPLWGQVRAHGTGYVEALVAKYLAPFDNGVEHLTPTQRSKVAEKKRNTADLLAAAKSYTANDCRRFEQNLYVSTGPSEESDD